MAALSLVILTILLIYIYIGYPLILFVMAKLFPQPHRLDDGNEPSVTLVISAHNEEKIIASKILNSLELDYPAEKLMIMVVSDGSTDETDNIVLSFQSRGVVLLRSEERHGKTAGLNLALGQITSEIVVFSDANAIYDKHAIRRMVRHFSDEKVGYVVGHARYEDAVETAAGSSEGAYWGIEVRMKQWESTFSSVVGGDGAIYAIRRHLYEPLQDSDINDFVNPLQIVAKGYRGIFDAEAWCSEKTAGEFGKEFARKVRIANRSFNGLLRVPSDCNPLKVGRFAWMLVSHKLLRWFSPFLLGIHYSFALAVGRDNRLLSSFVLVIIALYGILAFLALIGWWHAKEPKTAKLFYFPYYFILMNFASAVGIVMRLQGRVITTWDTVRQEKSSGTRLIILLPILLFGVFSVSCAHIFLWFGFGEILLYGTISALVLTLFYTYIGYPIVLAGLSSVKPAGIAFDEQHLPEVTLLIIAYNEEREIEEKLNNSLALDYPPHLLHVIVASDGSTDATNSIVLKFKNQGVRLLAYAENRGKISALNGAMQEIQSEIVVFSDANVMYDRQALRKLVRNFSDPRVGLVSGRVILLNDTLSYGSSEKAYYGIEHFIQEKEGKTGALVGADGAMYAIRRSLFHPPASDTILDDFVIAMKIACAGHLAIHEREALGFERNGQEVSGEFRRKTRIIAGGFQCLLRGDVLPPFHRPVLLMNFISHKILRWLNGVLTASLFVLLILARFVSNDSILLLSILFYIMVGSMVIAAIAHIAPIIRKIRAINMLHYLYMLSLASLAGLYRELTGGQKVTWRGGVAKCAE